MVVIRLILTPRHDVISAVTWDLTKLLPHATVPVIEPVTMVQRVMLYYGRLVSLRLSIKTCTADILNHFSLKYMLNH